MAPTSDERREVARMLRWFASLYGNGNVAYVTVERMLNLDYSDGFGGGAVTSESVRRLADLIDPTCCVESVASTGGLLAYNLSCGDKVFVHPGELMPSYCPHCGARVVSYNGN